MSLISRIFSGSSNEPVDQGKTSVGPASAIQQEEISVEILKQLIPIRNLEDEELSAFATEIRPEKFPLQSTLFESGVDTDSVLYLLDGTVSMETECGKNYTIDSDSAKARFPLSSGRKHSATAKAESEVCVLRVSNRIMGSTETVGSDTSFTTAMSKLNVSSEVRESRLFEAFCQHFSQDSPKLPTLPDVAVKLREAIEKNGSLNDVVEIVQVDTTIAAKLIQVANCPLYVASKSVNNCRDAVLRLGLNATRNLVTSISIKHLMQCKQKEIRQRLKALWKQNANLSCLSFVLASETKAVNPEEALLAGLICDVGVIPFLQFVDNFPVDLYEPEEIDLIAPIICAPAGAFLLKKWDFPENLVAIPELAEKWYHDESDTLDLADIVILSKLHSYIGTPNMANLPAINSIPACSKLKDGTLSPEHSLSVLHNAKDRIKEAFSIFAS